MKFAELASYYAAGFLISTLIFTYRAINRMPAQDPGPLDILWWLFGWWFLLPIFLFRWVKYKVRGKKL